MAKKAVTLEQLKTILSNMNAYAYSLFQSDTDTVNESIENLQSQIDEIKAAIPLDTTTDDNGKVLVVKDGVWTKGSGLYLN